MGDLDILAARAETHHTDAANAAMRWRVRMRYLKEYCRANRYTEGQRREKVSKDWDLSDAMDEWSWHRREAMRLDSQIMRRLMMDQYRRETAVGRTPYPRQSGSTAMEGRGSQAVYPASA